MSNPPTRTDRSVCATRFALVSIRSRVDACLAGVAQTLLSVLQRRKARVRGTLLILTLVVLACHRETPRAPTKIAESEFESRPSRNAYAGSASCRECHESDFERWSHDWHARALTPADPKNVAGDFGGRHFRGESSEAWMSRKDGKFVMRTRNRDSQL